MTGTDTNTAHDLATIRKLGFFAGAVIFLSIGGFAAVENARAELFLAVAGLAALAMLFLRIIPNLVMLIEAAQQQTAEARADAKQAACQDLLTELPNRKSAFSYLDLLLSNASRQNVQIGISLIDVKGLRQVNTDHGRDAGDLSLRRAAGVIKTEIRKGDYAARIGEHEFLIVSAQTNSAAGLATVTSEVIARIGRPFDVGRSTIRLSCTAGLIVSDPAEADAEGLIGKAEIALRAARETGADCALFDERLRMNFDAGLSARVNLADALKAGEIIPWFQPQIRLTDGALVGVEALARWQHPERGILGPGTFLPIAEEFGLLERIDEMILDQSLDALCQWRDAGLNVPRVSVNLSARHLNDPFLTERIKWALELRNLNPDSLCIEVLESVLITSADCAIARNIGSLSRIGVQIDLDDFGTGHSSIATLDRISVDRIKIDRAFISGIDQDPKRKTFLKALVDLAGPLEINVLAEGVETDAEQQQVAALGCTEAQGFGIARPMSAEKLAEWVRSAIQPMMTNKRGNAPATVQPRLSVVSKSA